MFRIHVCRFPIKNSICDLSVNFYNSFLELFFINNVEYKKKVTIITQFINIPLTFTFAFIFNHAIITVFRRKQQGTVNE